MSRIFNISVGVLGHVDSGKTALSKCLSQIASTACFDKNPQSKERGITLDLGFSSFFLDHIPKHLQTEEFPFDQIQYTLVDCPGHASLIKTVIGGAHIIDIVLLVVDIVKGVQTQTAECLVIAEVTTKAKSGDRMVIALNKIDQIEESKREVTIDRMKKRLWKTLEGGKFANCPIVPISALNAFSPADGDETNSTSKKVWGIEELINVIEQLTPPPKLCRNLPNAPFVLSVDHCFGIRGQGTVLTGTVLSGSLRLGDTIEIPSLAMTKKVKSIQIFRKPVDSISQGDRAGVCVTQFDPELLERGLACHPPGYLQYCNAAIIEAHKINYFRGLIKSKAKFHIIIGHQTVIAQILLFQASSANPLPTAANVWHQEYAYLDQWPETERNFNSLMLLQFEKPVLCPLVDPATSVDGMPDTLIIGSRLDTDITANVCRLAFHGRLVSAIKDTKESLRKLKIYQMKSREGVLERVQGSNVGIVKQLFKKETNLEAFCGLKVYLSHANNVKVRGVIEGGFGLSGKCKVSFYDDLPEEIVQKFAQSKSRKGAAATSLSSENEQTNRLGPIIVHLEFKRYLFDTEKRMIQ